MAKGKGKVPTDITDAIKNAMGTTPDTTGGAIGEAGGDFFVKEERTLIYPPDIVNMLSKEVIGQDDAKRLLAVESFKRMASDYKYRDNILLSGNTGTGKTLLITTLAKELGLVFLNEDITNYSETGYVGKSVDEIPKYLVQEALQQIGNKLTVGFNSNKNLAAVFFVKGMFPRASTKNQEALTKMLIAGELDDFSVVVNDELREAAKLHGVEPKANHIPISDAKLLFAPPIQDSLGADAVEKELNNKIRSAIVLVDEIDKIIEDKDSRLGQSVSRSGVQRSLLALVHGKKYNVNVGGDHGGGRSFPVDTSTILFVGCGAFQMKGIAKEDMMPELRGRFPKYATLNSLGKPEYLRILTEPKSSPFNKYQEIFGNIGVTFTVTPDALDRMAEYVHELNKSEKNNLGARRVNGVFCSIADEILFNAKTMDKTYELTAEKIASLMPLERLMENKRADTKMHVI